MNVVLRCSSETYEWLINIKDSRSLFNTWPMTAINEKIREKKQNRDSKRMITVSR